MNILIEQVQSDRHREDFLNLRKQVYADDPYVLPAAEAMPDHDGALLAYENTECVARCLPHHQTGNSQIGTIGLFEALNRPDAAKKLLAAAIGQLTANGANRVIGPMNGDTWHAYRFNTGPFDRAPFVKEPWNPSYYPDLWLNAGFTVAETYDSFTVDSARAAESQEKYYNRCTRQGYTFLPITTHTYRRDLETIYDLSCRIFADNVLYTPIDRDEFLKMYEPARPLLRRGFSWIARSPDQKPVGYVFAFPDYAEAIRAMRGNSCPSAKIRFLINRRKARRICIKTLGTLPERRGSGLSAALTYLVYRNSVTLGYQEALMCLMHSSNDSRRFGGGADRPFRSYALYEYPL